MADGLSLESIKRLRELTISGPDSLSPYLVDWVAFCEAASAYNEEKIEPIDARKQTKKFYMGMDRKYKVKAGKRG